jgi:hypothetical protein
MPLERRSFRIFLECGEWVCYPYTYGWTQCVLMLAHTPHMVCFALNAGGKREVYECTEAHLKHKCRRGQFTVLGPVEASRIKHSSRVGLTCVPDSVFCTADTCKSGGAAGDRDVVPVARLDDSGPAVGSVPVKCTRPWVSSHVLLRPQGPMYVHTGHMDDQHYAEFRHLWDAISDDPDLREVPVVTRRYVVTTPGLPAVHTRVLLVGYDCKGAAFILYDPLLGRNVRVSCSEVQMALLWDRGRIRQLSQEDTWDPFAPAPVVVEGGGALRWCSCSKGHPAKVP